MSELLQMDVSNLAEHITGVIKEGSAQIADRQFPKRNPIFNISDCHRVSTFQIQRRTRPRLIQTETAKRSRATREIAFRGRQLLGLPWSKLRGSAKWMIPAEANGRG